MLKKDINNKLKDVIKTKMDEMDGKIPFEEAKELIRPHFMYDTSKLIEKALEAKTRSIIRTLRDADGVRIAFSNDESMYIDIGKTLDMEDLVGIEQQLRRKLNGLKKALKKIRQQKRELKGQIDLFESDVN